MKAIKFATNIFIYIEILRNTWNAIVFGIYNLVPRKIHIVVVSYRVPNDSTKVLFW